MTFSPILTHSALPNVSPEPSNRLHAVRLTRSAKKTFYAFDYYPTGSEIISTFSKLHGTPTKVEAFIDGGFEKAIQQGGRAVS